MINAAAVDRITAFRAGGYPVISVYVSTGDDLPDLRTRVGNLLHQIRPLVTDGSLGRAARTSIRTDLERIESVLCRASGPGATAVFACAGRSLFEEITLPRPVRDRIVVDGSPWVRPMTAVLDEYPRWGVVLAARGVSRIWELSAGRLHDAAGRPDQYDLLVVGGSRPEVSGYVAALPRVVGKRVVATFTLDPSAATVDDVEQVAAPLASEYDADTQRRRVSEVFDLYYAGGLAVLGLGACLQAGSVGAISTLVVEAGAGVAGVVCEACGWLGLSGRSCAACECPVRVSRDVIDELAESVIDQGGAVRRIRVDTPLRSWTCVASLRYALPVGEPDRAEIVTTGQVR